jgi:tRNA G18 (ribose-2'-O)-methylase SpoU
MATTSHKAVMAGCAAAVFSLGWYLGAARARAGSDTSGAAKRDTGAGAASWGAFGDGGVGEFEVIDRGEMDRADLELRRVRKVEAVVRRRTSRVVLVLERTTYAHNYSAVMRTAEALGVQNVWVINPPQNDDPYINGVKGHQKKHKEDNEAADAEHGAFARTACSHLWIRTFDSTAACVAALREDGRALWVTDLSQAAESLDAPRLKAAGGVPRRLALAFGTESTGASPTLLAAADLRVYLPLHGFADSLNLSVAAALILFKVMALCGPSVVGDMSESDRRLLRAEWFPRLARNEAQLAQYAALVDAPPLPLSDLRVVNEQRRTPAKKTLKNQVGRGDSYEVGIGH